MAGYSVFIKPSAAKELDAVGSRRDRQRISTKVSALADDPRPRGCERLAGYEDRYRIRQGDYRVVYSIDDGERKVLVVKIAHRRAVYR